MRAIQQAREYQIYVYLREALMETGDSLPNDLSDFVREMGLDLSRRVEI